MKVFLCEPIHPAAYRLLEQNAEIIADRARMSEANALISRMIPANDRTVSSILFMTFL